MAVNLATKLRTGISPRQFMDGIDKNRDAFLKWYNEYEWANKEDEEFFASLRNRDDLRCLILSAEWCGDVVRNVPVIFRALEISGIPTEVLIMEQHLETMDQFLTGGGRAIPIVIFTDTSGVELGKWGPRPANVQAVMTEFKRQNPDREAADYQEKIAVARTEMGRQYGEGTGYQTVIITELRDLISSL
jgi:hypothetical protein